MGKLIVMQVICFVAMYRCGIACGQTTLEAEFRPRTEFRQGFRKPLADTLAPAFFTIQRTRLNADYKGKILNARISLEDSRVWGSSEIKTNSSKVEIYEAWFELLITYGLSAQFGRQPLKYDDQRLLAAPSWGTTGIAHDILVLKYKNSSFQTHLGIAFNNCKDTLMKVAYGYSPLKAYKAMAYGWFEKKILNGSTFSLIGIVEGFEGSDYKTVFNRVTYGGNLNLTNALSPLCINFTGYMQRGKTPQKTFGNGYASLEAFFLASSVRYKLTGKVSTNIGLDYYSGSDNNIDTGISDTFNRLYGSTHIYNGFMEYFVILPIQGLMDYYGGVNANLTPKFSVDLTFHIFWMDKDFIYKSDNISKNLGAEADLTLNYTLSKEVCIQAGYSRYFKSESTDKYHKMENVEAQQAQWAYMMLTVKPQLYKTQPISESK